MISLLTIACLYPSRESEMEVLEAGTAEEIAG